MPRVLYFAYGALMEPIRLRRRCRGAVALGKARLDGYRLAFTRYSTAEKGGVADIVPEPGATVWGVLWDADEEHLETLDQFHEAPRAYRRETVRVIDDQGGGHEAVAYVANRTGEFAPSRQYLAIVAKGARAHGLPEEYVGAIEQVRAHS